jgi:hypothetical protein
MMRKGGAAVIASVLIITVVVSALLGQQTYSLASFKTSERIKDVENYIKVHSLVSYFDQHYLNQSLLYTSWQKSYELGLKGGGIEPWPEEPPKIEKFEEILADEMEKGKYFRSFYGEECSVSLKKYSIKIIEREHEDSFVFEGKNEPLEVSCEGEKLENSAYLNIDRKIESVNNRYFYLIKTALEFVKKLKEKLDKIPDPSDFYMGEGIASDEKTAKEMAIANAKLNAELSYRAKMSNAIKESLEEIEKPEKVEISVVNLGEISELGGPAFLFKFIDTEVVYVISVPCGENLCYKATAKTRIDPEELNPKVELVDKKYFLPFSVGFENLRLVFTYKYVFEK